MCAPYDQVHCGRKQIEPDYVSRQYISTHLKPLQPNLGVALKDSSEVNPSSGQEFKQDTCFPTLQ
jgi:hypothetical protein